MRRFWRAVFHPSTIVGCWYIQQNGKWRSNVNVKCRIVDVSLIISASSDRRRIKLPPFDSSRWGGSIESCFILLQSLDADIFNETCCFLILISTCRNYLISVGNFNGMPAKRIQFPLQDAFALTVHKTKGLTISHSILSLEN